MALFHVNESDFEEKVLNNSKTVLVDFYATWCGPCKMLAPVLEELADEDDSFDIAKIDTDECPGLAMQYQVSAIPSLMVFKNGSVQAKTMGFMQLDDIRDFVASVD